MTSRRRRNTNEASSPMNMKSSSSVGIDPERIVNASDLIQDYVCSICQCLFWKPRACAHCQNILCESCIQTWQKTSDRCPFGCDSYRDQRSPPIVLSALSRLKLRCRYESFGCQEIILYDRLEQHEGHKCPFRPSQVKRSDPMRILDDWMARLRKAIPIESWKNDCLNELRSASLTRIFVLYLACYIALVMLWNRIPTRIFAPLTFLSSLFYRRSIKSSANQCQAESILPSIVAASRDSVIGVCGTYLWINWAPYYFVVLVLLAMSIWTRSRFI